MIISSLYNNRLSRTLKYFTIYFDITLYLLMRIRSVHRVVIQYVPTIILLCRVLNKTLSYSIALIKNTTTTLLWLLWLFIISRHRTLIEISTILYYYDLEISGVLFFMCSRTNILYYTIIYCCFTNAIR